MARRGPTERPAELLRPLNVDDVVLAGTVLLQVGGKHDVGRVESRVHELRVRCEVARVAILVERRDPAAVRYKRSARKGERSRLREGSHRSRDDSRLERVLGHPMRSHTGLVENHSVVKVWSCEAAAWKSGRNRTAGRCVRQPDAKVSSSERSESRASREQVRVRL